MKKPFGIALVVTLLFALLLFIAIVAVSSSLSLSGKRVTSNQKAALEAQYAAESGLALATTRLSLVGSEVADFVANVSDFEMPSGTDWASLRTYLQKFCGITSDPGDPAFVPTDKPAVGSVICTADPDLVDWSDPRAAPYSIFLDGHIDAARYPGGTAPEDYWRTRLGPQTFERTLKSRGRLATAYTVTYGFVPWRAEVLPNAAVRLTFRARPTVSNGFLAKDGADVARHKIEQTFTGELRIDLRPPSFSHFMLFTNYQRAGAGAGAERVYFYDGTLFDGPVHTNDKFNFTGRPWFGDDVTSVGCEAENADKDACTDRRPGYYYWDAGAKRHVKVTPPIDPIPPAWAEPAFEGGHAWDKDYIALPKASGDQYRAAKSGGLFIEDDDATSSTGAVNVEAVTLSTDVVAGVKYQFVQVHGRRNVGTRTVPGRCVADPPPPPPGPPGPPSPPPPPPPPPPPEGPSVERWGPPLLQGLLHFAARLGAPGPGRAAAAWIAEGLAATVRAQAGTCPPGQHWVGPTTAPDIRRFTYAFRIDAAGNVERNDGSGWYSVGTGFNGVIYVGRDVPGGRTSSFTLQGGGVAPPTSDVRPWETHRPRSRVARPGLCPYTVTTYRGGYDCIQPSIADFMQLTVVGRNIGLNRDLVYEDRPCTSAPERRADGSVAPADCPNLGARNVLGVYSDRGAIVIKGNAPYNLHIDGVLMSASRSVYYQRWNSGPPKGYLHLTGGLIQNWYGRFGKLKPDLTIRNGYGRKFTYDPRMRNNGLVPPFFPTFDGELPWGSTAEFAGPAGGSGSGFWKPVEGP